MNPWLILLIGILLGALLAALFCCLLVDQPQKGHKEQKEQLLETGDQVRCLREDNDQIIEENTKLREENIQLRKLNEEKSLLPSPGGRIACCFRRKAVINTPTKMVEQTSGDQVRCLREDNDLLMEENTKLREENIQLHEEMSLLNLPGGSNNLIKMTQENSQLEDENNELQDQVQKLKTLIRELHKTSRPNEFVEAEVAALLGLQRVIDDRDINERQVSVERSLVAAFIAFLLIGILVFSTSISGGLLMQRLFSLFQGVEGADVFSFDMFLSCLDFWVLPFLIVATSLLLHHTFILVLSAFQRLPLKKCRALFLVVLKHVRGLRASRKEVCYFSRDDAQRWCSVVDYYFTNFLGTCMFAGALLGRSLMSFLDPKGLTVIFLPLVIFSVLLWDSFVKRVVTDKEKSPALTCYAFICRYKFMGKLVFLIAVHIISGLYYEDQRIMWRFSPGAAVKCLLEDTWAGAIQGAMWWTVITVVQYLAADLAVRWYFKEEQLAVKLTSTIETYCIELGGMSDKDSCEAITSCCRIYSQTDYGFAITLRDSTTEKSKRKHGLILSDDLQVLEITDGLVLDWNHDTSSDTWVSEGCQIVEVNGQTEKTHMKMILDGDPEKLCIMVQRKHEEQSFWLITKHEEQSTGIRTFIENRLDVANKRGGDKEIEVVGPYDLRTTVLKFQGARWRDTHMIIDQNGEEVEFWGSRALEASMKEQWWSERVKQMLKRCFPSDTDQGCEIFFMKIEGMPTKLAKQTFHLCFRHTAPEDVIVTYLGGQTRFVLQGREPKHARFLWAPSNICSGGDYKPGFLSVNDQFELHGGIVSLGISFAWKDQGWGDREGAVELQICRNSEVVVQKLLLEEKPPHQWTTVRRMTSVDLSHVRAKDQICLRYSVGEGKCHMLHIKDICVWGEYEIDTGFTAHLKSFSRAGTHIISPSHEYTLAQHASHTFTSGKKRKLASVLMLWTIFSVGYMVCELWLRHHSLSVLLVPFAMSLMLHFVDSEIRKSVPSLQQYPHYRIYMAFFSVLLVTAFALSIGLRIMGEHWSDVLDDAVNMETIGEETLPEVSTMNYTTDFDTGYAACRIKWGGRENPLSIVDLAALANDAYMNKPSQKILGDIAEDVDCGPPCRDPNALPKLSVSRFGRDTIVLAVKGSSTFQDTFADASFYGIIGCLQTLSLAIDYVSLSPHGIIAGMLEFFYLSLQTEIDHFFNVINNTVSHMARRFPNATIVFTGHSLGGGIASAVGAKLEKPTVVFSAPGGHYSRRLLGDYTMEQAYRNVLNIVPNNDMVPLVDRQVGAVQRIVCLKRVTTDFDGLVPPAPLKGCHDYWQTFCELLRACGAPPGRDYVMAYKNCKWTDHDFKDYLSRRNEADEPE